MPVHLEFRLLGTESVQQLLDANVLYRPALARLMQKAGRLGVQIFREDSPYRTGRLRKEIHYRTQRRETPLWVSFTSTARSNPQPKYPRGFPYPRLLNYVAKYHHLNWWTSKIPRAVREISSLLNDMARDLGGGK